MKQEQPVKSSPDTATTEDISRVDTDGNGQVTIQEAKDADHGEALVIPIHAGQRS